MWEQSQEWDLGLEQTNPSRLAQAFENCNGNSASGDNLNHAKESNPEIIGDVYIHPSANIHPSAVVSNIKLLLGA